MKLRKTGFCPADICNRKRPGALGIYMPGGAQPHPREKYAGGAIDLQKIPLIHWIQVGNM